MKLKVQKLQNIYKILVAGRYPWFPVQGFADGDDVVEKLKNTPITDEVKEKLQEQVGQEDESPDRYYKQKFRFHRD